MILVYSKNFVPKKENFVYVLCYDGLFVYYSNQFIEFIKKEYDLITPDQIKSNEIFSQFRYLHQKGDFDYIISPEFKNKFKKILPKIYEYYEKNNNIEKLLFILDYKNNFELYEAEQKSSFSSIYYRYNIPKNKKFVGIMHNHPMNLYCFSSIDNEDTKHFVGFDFLISYPQKKSEIVACRFNVLGKIWIPLSKSELIK